MGCSTLAVSRAGGLANPNPTTGGRAGRGDGLDSGIRQCRRTNGEVNPQHYRALVHVSFAHERRQPCPRDSLPALARAQAPRSTHAYPVISLLFSWPRRLPGNDMILEQWTRYKKACFSEKKNYILANFSLVHARYHYLYMISFGWS